MERLTDKKEADAQRREYENRLKNGYPRNIQEERFLKLAAYEDAGLELEEVAEYKRLCDSYVEAGLDAKFVQFCIDATRNGLSMNRICELAQAEKDGRLVVLPEVQERDRKSFVDGLQDYFQEASFYDPSTGMFGMSEGEKELASALMNALTREEAEAALKKREEAEQIDTEMYTLVQRNG